ncbi:MAG: 50S ribosomal protein L10 [Nitrososphaerales archaeon]
MQVVKERRYPEKKVKMLNKLVELGEKYRCIAISNLHKVRTAQIAELKKRLRGKLEILVAKNTIAKKAFSKLNLPKDFLEGLKGSNAFIFTNLDAFSLYLLMEKNKTNVPAKSGDIATDDIILPAGNTGLPPGPVLSEFKTFNVPTRIDAGSIWIDKDTLVAKKGDLISPTLSSLLSKLNIKPIKAGLSISLAYMDGLVCKEIKLDIKEYENYIQEALREAHSLAIGIKYPAREILPKIVMQLHRESLALANRINYYDRDTLPLLIGKALTQAQNIKIEAEKKGYSS